MKELAFQEYPASALKTEYLMVMIHGYGSNGGDLIKLAPEFAQDFPNMHFVSPNGAFPFEGGGPSFQWYSLANRSLKKMKTGTDVAEPIINNFIDQQLARFSLDDSKLIIAGFSQGGMLSIYTALRRKAKCAGAISFSGYILLDPNFKNEIVSYPEILLCHGMEDQVVTFETYLKTKEHLEKSGLAVSTCTSQNLGHGIDISGIKAAQKFLKQQIG